MKQFYFLFLFLWITVYGFAQSQCPVQPVQFFSQAKVDAFIDDYPDCTHPVGIWIQGDDITNLDGLSNLKVILGSLYIGINPQLTDLSGLSNLERIEGFLQIKKNEKLTSLDGLNNVQSVRLDLQIEDNALLTQINLSALTSVATGSIIGKDFLSVIKDNPRLEEINMESLTRVGLPESDTDRSFVMADNPALHTINMDSLSYVKDSFRIQHTAITNLSGLGSLETVGGSFNMDSNPNLTSYDGLNSLVYVGKQLTIQNNPLLTSITALENVDTHNINRLTIRNNESLSFCNLPNFCRYLADDDNARTIENNAPNCNSDTQMNTACTISISTGNILYVDQAVDQSDDDYTGSGNSWANALPDLAPVLQWAQANKNNNLWDANNPLKIYVAVGTYRPSVHPGSNETVNGRNATFLMVNNVQLYGGFDPANGKTGLSERILPPVTLSGVEGAGNDGTILLGEVPNGQQAFHVILSVHNVGNALLDGFTITGGHANGNENLTVNGEDISRISGGGIYSNHSSLSFTNINLIGNEANFSGGGMFNDNSSPGLTNVTITGNKTNFSGGGMFNLKSSPTLSNVTLVGNISNQGSGMSNVEDSSPKISNSIVWGQIYNSNGSYTANYSLIESSADTNSGNIDATDLSDADIFTDPANNDYTLIPGSPAINAGNNDNVKVNIDLTGNTRIRDNTVDLGAYEVQDGNTVTVVSPTDGIIYVNKNGIGDGSSWDNALSDLAPALKWAHDNKNNNLWDEANPLKIYVAKGTYKPQYSPSDDNFGNDAGRDNAFLIVKNVQLYGGFDPANGIETLNDDRDFSTSGGTILSGDLNGDDGANFANNTENTYHVLISVNDVGNALLDGFTITGGNANSDNNISVNGKLIYQNYGGGMYNDSSSPILIHVIISGNKASSGGGMYNHMSSLTLTNMTISGNVASSYFGGGMWNYNFSLPVLTNVTISGNTAPYGGGMSDSSSSPVLVNVTISGNTAGNAGGAMYDVYSSPKLYNSIVWGNGSSNIFDTSGSLSNVGSNNLIQGLDSEDERNIPNIPADLDVENLFEAPQVPGLSTAGNYRLKPGSIAVNAGNNQWYTDADKGNGDLENDLDLAGNPRLFQRTIDLGAYESQIALSMPDADNILYVNQAVNKDIPGYIGDGSSWANAITELADALKWAKEKESDWTTANPLQIYVAKGTYKPLYSPRDGANFADEGRDNTFLMVKNVQLYGGFDPANGIETLNDDRILPNVTLSGVEGSILSGELQDDNDITNNVRQVVISADDVGNALLDGFTITGGNANGSNIISVNGQDIWRYSGGGMVNSSSSPSLTDVNITGNTAGSGGGGMYNTSSSPSLTHVNITGNTASSGGGMYNSSSSPGLTNVSITGNTATNTGGMYNYSSSPSLTNVTLAGNTANSGGVMSNYDSSSPTINNSIVWGTIYNIGIGSSYTANYSLIHSDNENGNIDVANYNGTDIFTNPANGDYSLKDGSPAIDAGSNSLYTGDINNDLDLAGNPRLVGSTIDMGAFENQPTPITPDADNILYVNQSVSGGDGSGDSWENAITELADALKWAQENKGNSTPLWDEANPLQIYVAKGTYKPLYSPSDDNFGNDAGRDNAFLLVKDVQLYGGFDPDKNINTLADERILPGTVEGFPEHGGTVLSGDLGSDNAYHVLISANDVGNALLDGFTITAGNANGGNSTIAVNAQYNIWRNSGGGMYNRSSSPGLTHVTITGNRADVNGGGMFNDSSSPELTHVNIIGNTVYTAGGGMFNDSSSPGLTYVTLTGNTANTAGGGMYNLSSSPGLTHVTITGNTANTAGGGMFNASSSPGLTNVTIAGNTADFGGGMVNASSSLPTINNSIVWGEIINDIASYTASYSLIKGDSSTANGNIDASGLLDTDIFTDPSNGDYTLQSGSPAIDAGSNSLYTGDINNDLDLAGNPRLFGNTIDMGAFENQTTPITPNVDNMLYVNQSVSSGDGSGDSWANAITELADALLYARQQNNFTAADPLQIYVAKGTYKPLYNAKDGNYTINGNRDNAFVMVKNVQLYGGFDPVNGIETLNDDRDFSNSGGTILSGDLNGDDGANFANNTENTYHVLISANDVGNALLDGFTITAGNANGSSYIIVNEQDISQYFGGGMYNDASSPVLTNVTINGNITQGQYPAGGGMYNKFSAPTLTNVTISENTAFGSITSSGGGMFNYSSSPVLTNVTISGNTARSGGGMDNSDSSSPVLTNVIINGNTATLNGGGMWNSNFSLPVLTNVTISGNTALSNGGAMYNVNSSFPVLYNSIVWGNNSGIHDNAIDESSTHNLIQEYNGDANISGIPLGLAAGDIFLSPVEATHVPTADGDYNLKAGSPAINTGDNSFYSGDLENDLDLTGNLRWTGTIIDLGAYESPYEDIASVADLADIEVSYGTTLTDVPLPTDFSVQATLTDGSTPDVALDTDTNHWIDLDNYDPNTVATYVFEVPVLPVNPDATPWFTHTQQHKAILKITVQKDTLSGLDFADRTATYDGTVQSIEITGLPDPLPDGVTVSYTIDGNDGNSATDTGEYEITASVDGGHSYKSWEKTARLIITQAKLTVTADPDQSKLYGEADPELTYDVQGWRGMDDDRLLEGSLIREEGEAPGSYAITLGTLSAGDNYTIEFKEAVLTILPAAFSDIRFEDEGFTYDGKAHSIYVSGAPEDADISYTNNEQTEAGEYSVEALVSLPGYEAQSLTAVLRIKKASQEISFEMLADKQLEEDDSFQLMAVSSSGLPVSYTYSYSGAPAARVSSEGWVELLGAGSISISAHQPGNENYEAAEPVTRTLEVKEHQERDLRIDMLYINGLSYPNPAGSIYYTMDCGDTSEAVSIEVITAEGVMVSPGDHFRIAVPHAGVYRQEVKLSADGKEEVYELWIEKRLDIRDIVIEKYNNVLLVNNNPDTNGGYSFTGYRWFKNGELIGEGQYYSAGAGSTDRLDAGAGYEVEVTTGDGRVLRSCEFRVSNRVVDYEVLVYPNPVRRSSGAMISSDFPDTELQGGVLIQVYSLSGKLLLESRTRDREYRIDTGRLPSGMYLVLYRTPGYSRTTKIVVE